jgi:hypothetical protein
MHGFMSYLSQTPASAQLAKLKDLITVKVIPMLNADGVIGGNYRTSFVGKDNNRLYVQNEDAIKVNKLLIPEIRAVKNLVLQHKEQMLAFIDTHHHSVKRASFMYGPCVRASQDATLYY